MDNGTAVKRNPCHRNCAFLKTFSPKINTKRCPRTTRRCQKPRFRNGSKNPLRQNAARATRTRDEIAKNRERGRRAHSQNARAGGAHEGAYRHVHVGRTSLPAVEALLVPRLRYQLAQRFQILLVLLSLGGRHGSRIFGARAYIYLRRPAATARREWSRTAAIVTVRGTDCDRLPSAATSFSSLLFSHGDLSFSPIRRRHETARVFRKAYNAFFADKEGRSLGFFFQKCCAN